MIRYQILPDASAELDAALLWYEEQREGLGVELLDDYETRLAQALREFGVGSIARTLGDGTEIRRYRLRRFRRYAILMAVLDGTPTVVAFEHGSRQPEYWRGRLG